MSHLKTAYQLGALTAYDTFLKTAGGEYATPTLGALGPAFGGLGAGLTSPKGTGYAVGSGAAVGGGLGGLGGGLSGAALGALIGSALGKEHTGTGATLGGLAGVMGGGAYGAHKGRLATRRAILEASQNPEVLREFAQDQRLKE